MYQGSSNLPEKILRCKETNQIEGIYGRMGDLGAIDAKYDVALSTVCPGLDSIILVETADVALKCFDLVLEKNLGNAKFMILEKLERHHDQLKRKENTPEDVPRLFDLIQVKDERFKLGFYELTRDTLVAGDSEQASRIAFESDNEFKVVTLDGSLYDSSGGMMVINKQSLGKVRTLTEVEVAAKELSALSISTQTAIKEMESEEPKEEVIEVEMVPKVKIKRMRDSIAKASLITDNIYEMMEKFSSGRSISRGGKI